jgi:tripartite-type tricarboxylate transporter receptor subunit TctC
MVSPRRVQVIIAVIALAFACAAIGQAPAPGPAHLYPSKPVRLVVPFPPGGPADIIARTVAAKLGDALRQPFVIDSRGGGNGNIGAELVARAPADGHTLLLVPSALAANRSLYANLSYSLRKDFSGVAGLAVFPLLLVTHPSVQAASVRELITLARQSPGTRNFASAGSGGGAHLAAETFRVATGIEVVHVPYKGTGPAVAGILGGQVAFMFASIPSVIGHVRAGKLNALAISSARRSDALPSIPSVSESGLPGYELVSWFGLAAPAGTPQDAVTLLSSEVARVLRDAEFLERLKAAGGDPLPMSAREFDAFIDTELVRWSGIVRETGAKLE